MPRTCEIGAERSTHGDSSGVGCVGPGGGIVSLEHQASGVGRSRAGTVGGCSQERDRHEPAAVVADHAESYPARERRRSSAWRSRPFGASGAGEGLPHEEAETAARCGVKVVSSRGRSSRGRPRDSNRAIPRLSERPGGARAGRRGAAARTLPKIRSHRTLARRKWARSWTKDCGEP